MSANSYLERVAGGALLRELEKANVERSIEILQHKLDAYFSEEGPGGNVLRRHFIFGSYARGTILPRRMDRLSDVDYMVVFADTASKPQTCLDRLRRFVERNYESAEISQSNPTILLALNHIRFELVPAIDTFWSGIKIPSKGSSYSEWMSSGPNDFNRKLTENNKNNQNLIKPLARIVKYWNACNEYPFESFALENRIVSHWSLPIVFFGGNLWQRFVAFMRDLNGLWSESEREKIATAGAQRIIAEVKRLDDAEEYECAERELHKVLPEVNQ